MVSVAFLSLLPPSPRHLPLSKQTPRLVSGSQEEAQALRGSRSQTVHTLHPQLDSQAGKPTLPVELLSSMGEGCEVTELQDPGRGVQCCSRLCTERRGRVLCPPSLQSWKIGSAEQGGRQIMMSWHAATPHHQHRAWRPALGSTLLSPGRAWLPSHRQP